MEEMFESSIRSAGDFAAVFEFDGEISYFYLVSCGKSGDKIVSAIRINFIEPAIDSNIKITWSAEEASVALMINNCLFALFDVGTLKAYGGDPHKILKDCPENLIRAIVQ